MPWLNRERTLRRIDEVFGISAAVEAGVKPPNGMAELAKATGLHYDTLRNCANGRQQIAAYKVTWIANALRVTPKWLTAEEDKPGEPPAKTNKVETNTGPGRNGEKGAKTGPKRLTDGAAA